MQSRVMQPCRFEELKGREGKYVSGPLGCKLDHLENPDVFCREGIFAVTLLKIIESVSLTIS